MLSLSTLNKTYPNCVQALIDVSLDIPKGIYGLLGPNGAGKTSLMRTIAALQLADSGAIRFGDIDVRRDPDSLRERLAICPRTSAPTHALRPWNCWITSPCSRVSDRRPNVVPSWNSGSRKRNCGLCGIGASIRFSGGMRQRFGIAQALLGEPQLIIVDEPTAGLDPTERRRFHNLLATIGEQVVVILSTHIVDDVADLCPRMAIMGGGRVLLEGAPAPLVDAVRGKLWSVPVAPPRRRSSPAQATWSRHGWWPDAAGCGCAVRRPRMPGSRRPNRRWRMCTSATLVDHGLAEAA